MEPNRCVVCHEEATALLVIEDDERMLEVAVCEEHDFDYENLRVKGAKL